MKFRAVSLLRDSRPALLRVVAGSAALAAAAGFAPAQAAEKVLYRFTGGNDGAFPLAGLIFDSKGALYGTTASGGPHFTGTVFKLKPPVPPATQWTERLLYIFKVGSDGF